MALFRILKGAISRISMEATPFHDGYAYFTPENGHLYIDSEDNGEQRRIQVAARKEVTASINAVLLADAWVDGQQTISVPTLTETSNGVVSISQNATQEQFDEASGATIQVASQADGSIAFAYYGNAPTCDIPVVIYVMDNNSEIVYATLYQGAWANGKQTVIIDSVNHYTNGFFSPAQNLTSDQMTAVKEAELYVCGQTNGSVMVAVAGSVPSCDIPVELLLFS